MQKTLSYNYSCKKIIQAIHQLVWWLKVMAYEKFWKLISLNSRNKNININTRHS